MKHKKCVATCRRPGPRRWLPSFFPCAKYARADHDTCWHHRDWIGGDEGAAHLKLAQAAEKTK